MSTSPYVPYQAYKSKRHSRSFSNSLTVSPSPSPPRPSSAHDTLPVQHTPTPQSQSQQHAPENTQIIVSDGSSTTTTLSAPAPIRAVISAPQEGPGVSSSPSQPHSVPASPMAPPAPPVVVSVAQSTASTSTSSTPTSMRTRRTSTFRHVPSRATSTPVAPSPLSIGDNPRAGSLPSRNLDSNKASRPHSRLSTVTLFSNSSPTEAPPDVPTSKAAASTQPQDDIDQHTLTKTAGAPLPVGPPASVQRTLSEAPSHIPAASSPAVSPSPSSVRNGTFVRSPAPYRPGFQPKGVYRPLTDEFLEARRSHRDSGRVEQTRLERRLEKLINLHFGEGTDKRAPARPKQVKRMSSIWELDIRNMGPGDLWRGVVQSQVAPGSKADLRAAEQNITPWQSDADVSQCPSCAASFHPITNRKHHCRLCGKIICSLPVKRPQRPVTCSLLFVVDPKTGQIEEVVEGVDYGVRRRTLSSAGRVAIRDGLNPEEKFLKGIRICRDCRPALLRKQYSQDRVALPTFSKLYDVFISLEKEIEDALPQFQELLLTLSSEDCPTPEASAARKRLLDAFAQYDALAKRIRKLPTSGPGSSQDRVLAAVHTRANVFLQKHMFPLQSLPKPSKSASSQTTPVDGPAIDPHSELARIIQPLLEQEALLESFIEEAKAHRKFEDAKTLKSNLHEIRTEIDKLVAGAQEGGLISPQESAKSKNLTN
ncbi:FYVE zinc finger-domain-containing protein [Lactarius psammicola]|nr:FYVE zinc finger-domain-containing protein [Lactarius psammicola]